MAPLASLEPFRTVYITIPGIKILFRLAFLSLYYIPKLLRPLPEWSWRLSLAAAGIRGIFQVVTDIRYQRRPQLKPAKDSGRFVLIEPPEARLFSGPLSSNTVKPTPVGGMWFPTPPQREAERVVIQFPGGAFVLGWDPNGVGKRTADFMACHFKATHTLYVQYRLASSESPFPAALQDALTAYHHVLSLGVSPKNIIFAGDSAGSNLSIALLRYLESSHGDLPLPGGVMAWCPWVDLTLDTALNHNHLPNAKGDLLIPSCLEWGVNAYRPSGEVTSEMESYISPLHHPFEAKTPLFIQGGSGEAFYPLIKSFAEEMAGVKGNRVRFHTSELAPHDIFLMHHILGLKAQAVDGLK
ncbi:hypothetical protein M434DRAFT_17512 [Hypoxylon sp. CO27-5]|nr:hypothetical protein M434DRAFT_17512 [Hypoxylon sp. CO27-5]